MLFAIGLTGEELILCCCDLLRSCRKPSLFIAAAATIAGTAGLKIKIDLYH